MAISKLNSEPRPSLLGLSPLVMLWDAERLAYALGIENMPYDRLNLKVGAIDRDRKEKGLPPLI